jgi:hypothetical protein
MITIAELDQQREPIISERRKITKGTIYSVSVNLNSLRHICYMFKFRNFGLADTSVHRLLRRFPS